MNTSLKVGCHALTIIFLVGAARPKPAAPGPRDGLQLRLRKSVILLSRSGRVDQVVDLPGVGFVARNSDFWREQRQAIEVFDASGGFVRKVGGFGLGPGQYYRLTDVAVAPDGTIWATDVHGKVMRFTPSGRLEGSSLVQNPGYSVKAIALDGAHGVYYLAGCWPQRVYINLGCLLVHQYGLDGRYRRSFVGTEPEVLKQNLYLFEYYALDVDASGLVYFTESPLFKVFEINPAKGVEAALPVRSARAHPPGPLLVRQPRDYYDRRFEDSYMVDRVEATPRFLAVSIRCPKYSCWLLEVFTRKGRQVGLDIPAPGQLVGKSRNGDLYFARSRARGIELESYSLTSEH